MTIREAIEYLRPVADSTPLAGYGKALSIAIQVMEDKLREGETNETDT